VWQTKDQACVAIIRHVLKTDDFDLRVDLGNTTGPNPESFGPIATVGSEQVVRHRIKPVGPAQHS
jgi:hypothetical protein